MAGAGFAVSFLLIVGGLAGLYQSVLPFHAWPRGSSAGDAHAVVLPKALRDEHMDEGRAEARATGPVVTLPGRPASTAVVRFTPGAPARPAAPQVGRSVSAITPPPAAADPALDSDHDGLSNADEQRLGTNPDNPDTDGDGIPMAGRSPTA